MRLLLDTHAFLWWLAGSAELAPVARRAIGEEADEVFVSAASAWEITTKYRLGKLPSAALAAADVGAQVDDQGFLRLPIRLDQAEQAGRLPGRHRDPFDRVLIAQASSEDLTLVSNEQPFDAYGVHRLW